MEKSIIWLKLSKIIVVTRSNSKKMLRNNYIINKRLYYNCNKNYRNLGQGLKK